MAGTARERARAELTTEIKRLALQQLAQSGAAHLSLRGIARELGMVSSALYRYFRSRDELLTALIVDAYAELADALERSDSRIRRTAYRRRWLGVCSELRSWALDQPHRFTLLYGSPVPGYRAPADTIAPAARVMTALSGIVQGAAAADALGAAPVAPVADRQLERQLARVAPLLGPDVPAPVLLAAVEAFAQVLGLVNLELGGHLVGGFEPADRLFRHAVARTADTLGLQDREPKT